VLCGLLFNIVRIGGNRQVEVSFIALGH
jgi:hypothetical protein